MGGAGTGTKSAAATVGAGGIVSLQDMLDFLDISSKGIFEITASNDVLKLTSSEGGPCDIDVDDGTYEGSELATELTSKMNANDTLTGGVITFAVTYDTTTSKFTIDATAGHTIAFALAGSDAGLTFGFSKDHSAVQTITSDNAVPGDPSDIVQVILDSVEKWIKEYCHRDFIQTTYTNELYDGQGYQTLFLKHYPIIEVTELKINDEAIDPDDLITYENGTLYYPSGFPQGHQNISVTYSAGYTTMPEDLKFAVLTAVSYLYNKKDKEGFGLVEYSLGHIREKFVDILPPETMEILQRYKKVIIA